MTDGGRGIEGLIQISHTLAYPAPTLTVVLWMIGNLVEARVSLDHCMIFLFERH